MKLLAIETSCDETAIAIVEVKKPALNASDIADAGGEGKKPTCAGRAKFKILGNEVSSQIDIHKEYGGVFPALAKREHIKNLPLVLEKVLKQSKLKIEKIDAIAVTTGPGLEPALWTGIVFAKELSQKYKIPVVPVNHMEGHIFSIFPKKGKTFTVENNKELFPMLTLLVSGGHTELVLVKDWMKYKKIGQTRDDAAGEAFDKVARMLSLPYPGGPQISKLASIERDSKREDIALGELASSTERARGIFQQKNIRTSQSNIPSGEIILPRPMIYTKDYDFSFSGLKTAVLYMVRDIGELTDEIKKKIACEFENAVVETLVHKTVKAIKEYKIKTLIVGGGVSANTYLQEQMKAKIKKEKLKAKVHFPSKALTGDNGLMIAIAGYYQYQNKKYTTRLGTIKAKGNLSL